jgi:hypothetical protein
MDKTNKLFEMNTTHLFALLIILAFVSPLVFTYSVQLAPREKSHKQTPHIKFDMTRIDNQLKTKFDVCPLCVNLMGQTINQLLNIILNVGVIGSCSALCSYLGPYGQIAVTGCNLLCDYVGITEFIKLIELADLDPIWLCEELNACTIHDCTASICAEFKNTNVHPQSGVAGTTFSLSSVLAVYNQSGTGELLVLIQMPTGEVLEGGNLVPEGFLPGQYQVRFDIDTSDDPRQDPPLIFVPGKYITELVACQGMCGSKHSHSRTLAVVKSNFTITN